MSKPLIGILGHKHAGEYQDGYGQNLKYIGYFRKFGDVIILDAQNERVMDIDLLVLPGGRDVNPENYGAKPHIETQAPDLEYEWFMKNMLDKYLKKVDEGTLGVYGICAGFQHLTAHFGGTLSQDIAQDQSDFDRGELVDKLTFNKSVIESVIDKDMFRRYSMLRDFNMTNSIHHQGTFTSLLPKDQFEVIATNARFANVEFMIHKNRLIAAEQSHPEERANPLLSDILINSILNKVFYENKDIRTK